MQLSNAHDINIGFPFTLGYDVILNTLLLCPCNTAIPLNADKSYMWMVPSYLPQHTTCVMCVGKWMEQMRTSDVIVWPISNMFEDDSSSSWDWVGDGV